MRYRTALLWFVLVAGISCFVLLAGMFGLPTIVLAVFLPSLKQGIPTPIPAYERILLETADFCVMWRWLVALPLAGLGAALTFVGLTVPRPRG